MFEELPIKQKCRHLHVILVGTGYRYRVVNQQNSIPALNPTSLSVDAHMSHL